MSHRYPPATAAELDALEQLAITSTARRLTQDEDDALESPDREGTLRRLGVVTVRHRGRR